jgi:hypothetical protein
MDARLGDFQRESGQYGEVKILLYRESNSDSTVGYPVGSLYGDCATTDLRKKVRK